MLAKALFLDRDGVINVDHGYVYRKEDIEFIDGIFDLVSAAKKSGYLNIIVTNQSGIGRGYYTSQNFHDLTKWMKEQFVVHNSIIDAVYFCPYHPDGSGKYSRYKKFRKPEPGMILQAALEHNINLKGSILVGDSLSDIQAGIAAGVGKIFYYGSGDNIVTAHVVSHLTEIIPYL